MRILLADMLGPRDHARRVIDGCLAGKHAVSINLFDLTATDGAALQQLYRDDAQVRFCAFDPALPDALRKAITADHTGYDAVIYPPNIEGFTPEVLMAAVDPSLAHPLRIIGCANDAVSHLQPIKALAEEHHVSILHTQGIHAEAVAEYTLSQIGYHARDLGGLSRQTGESNQWPHRAGAQTGRSLQEKTIGVLGGSGADGGAVITLAKKMGLRVVAMGGNGPDSEAKIRALGAEVVHSLPELLQQADFLSVNCRKNDQTVGMIDAAAIGAMKRGMVIVNPAGADIIDKQALLAEYRKPPGERHIAATILDMPYGGRRDANAFAADPDNQTLKSFGVHFTPRVAGYTIETRAQGMAQLTQQVNRLASHDVATPLDKQQLVRDITALAKQAGEKAIVMRDAGLIIDYGKDGSPTTNADKMAADFIREGLIRKGYDFNFIGEEHHPDNHSHSGIDIIIDGIDGTRNFRDRNYGWCSSVAVRQGGEIIAGVVHDPHCDETFSAIKGEGAYHENKYGKKLLTTPETQPADFSFSVGSFRIQNSTAIKRKVIDDIKQLGGREREWGSVALSLCAVARGGLGTFIQGNSKLHDHAAGILIAQEAGASLVSRPCTEPDRTDIIAAHPSIAAQIERSYDSRISAISLLGRVASR